MKKRQHEFFSDFTIKWATSNWEISEAHTLRRQIFCAEQGIFEQDDRDDVDAYAQVLVAIANFGGWHERIVGTVRIHDEGDNVWWGSRLAVDPSFRTQVGLGAQLIKLAVSSAHALGCKMFLAQVQKQNERLFQRLHWHSEYELNVKRHPHVMMKADLSAYPPCYRPTSGFVVSNRHKRATNEYVAPFLTLCTQGSKNAA
ncbi:MSMEG_0567/Sll0786 family nitrogen starvation N-acetyltransferase [Agaribacter marinus]|nr:MSMEG_0567/Sll0786 family nitrogen starvation N-acetyltransferase [Agaribacter marinus]